MSGPAERADGRADEGATGGAGPEEHAAGDKGAGGNGAEARASGRKRAAAPGAARAERRTGPGSTRGAKLSDVVEGLAECDLAELWRFWAGDAAGRQPEDQAELRKRVLGLMSDPPTVEARIGALGRRLGALLDLHLEAPRYQRTRAELVAARALAYLSGYDLEASLTVLARRGLLVDAESARAESYGAPCTQVPAEIGDAVLRQRRARRRGIFDTFTLRGHLDRLYDDPARAARTPPSRVRELYKMYANEAAVIGRVQHLPDDLRKLVEKAVMEFGGILPRALFERLETDMPSWDARRWRAQLEEALVGTVERLELGRYGIQHNDETLIVFTEVTLAWLRRVAVPGDPDRPHEEISLGVDLASNISRFIGYIIEHDVRFTQRGEIFKTTERRILQELIPNPGKELSRGDVLAFIYGFARHAGLIESTGERTFALTAAGREWEPRELDAKLRRLVEYAVEERGLGGEHFHQVRMRRILLRLLKRVEPGVWYDLMYVPFLARNTYLCSLDDLAVEECFAARTLSGDYAPMEDVQRMAWNLVGWVRHRLYLLGIVDLGYDAAGRPVAIRLSRTGARALGLAEEEGLDGHFVGNLVVTPDFQVVLFPTGDDGELVHDLDRFCEREGLDGLGRFRISERSVHRALSEGMLLARIVDTLQKNARTPVPQNVLYSIRDWAGRAGLLVLDSELVLRGDDPEVVRRFAADPGVRPHVRALVDEHRVQLKHGSTPRRMLSLLRELGHLVELEG